MSVSELLARQQIHPGERVSPLIPCLDAAFEVAAEGGVSHPVEVPDRKVKSPGVIDDEEHLFFNGSDPAGV